MLKYSEKKTKTIEALRLRTKYPDRVPVIVLFDKDILSDKKKFLVPKHLTVGQFLHVIRKRVKISSEQALYMYCNNELPVHSKLISEIFTQYENEDGFLYVSVCIENTFGCVTKNKSFIKE
jgi:GABA(A) receptor-associated protein